MSEQLRLPYITLVDDITLPYNTFKKVIVLAREIKAIKRAMEQEREICILLKKKVNDKPLTNALYAKVIYEMEQGSFLRCKFEVLKIAKVLALDEMEEYGEAICEILQPFSENEELDRKLKEEAISALEQDVATSSKSTSEDSQNILRAKEEENIDKVINIYACYYGSTFDSKVKFVQDLCTTSRLKELIALIKSLSIFRQYEAEIESRVNENMSEAQKKYYLNEKRKAISQELGEEDIEDLDSLREKINSSSLPDYLKNIALKELSRLALMPPSSAEAAVSRNYIDFILTLPTEETKDSEDLAYSKQILEEEHYGLTKVKERVLEYLASKMMSGVAPQSILCLVGPPGVGKTSIARSIAKAMSKNFVKASLGGVKDESEIRGHRRTYVGALPGKILSSMVKAKSTNPLFLFDEIDKLSQDYKGDPSSALLEVLDSEQNKYFQDHYLDAEFDLSHVFFICTANYIENIPAPLRDRLEIIEMSSYTEFEKLEIARHHLLKKQLALHGLEEKYFSISDDAILKIIKSYTREAGVREVERLIGSLIRKTMKKILLKEIDEANISTDNLEEWLGKAKFIENEKASSDLVGVVNGLAYTEAGGDTLKIEAVTFKGEGKISLTGSLGDVMKESCETAYDYVKANAQSFGISEDKFSSLDVHIHFPEGATPKDGPSAGVAIALAIVSAFTNKEVNHTVALTGEISLTGNIIPIGGLREKSIAASRDGIKTIYIPAQNAVDLDEVPDSVKETLTINLASKAIDVINACLK